MKKRKIKLFASLTSLVMVVAVMAVGIFAATQATLTITASATFSVTNDLEATIWGESALNGATPATVNSAGLFYSKDVDATLPVKEGVTFERNLATKTIAFAAVEMVNNEAGDAATYSYTIKITNNLTSETTRVNKNIQAAVTFVAPATINNATAVLTTSGEGDAATFTIAPEATGYATVTVTIQDINAPATIGDIGMSIVLTMIV